MKNYLLTIVFVLTAFIGNSETLKSARLHGSLKEFNSDMVNMNPCLLYTSPSPRDRG